FKTDFIDKPALFSTEQIPCPSDFQIFHSNVETTSQIRKLFQSLEAFSGFFGHQTIRRANKITKRLFVASPDTTSHLVQIRQSEIVSIIDKNSVSIRYVQPAFDNRGGNQHIIFPIDKIE